jgi:hypothetical protein
MIFRVLLGLVLLGMAAFAQGKKYELKLNDISIHRDADGINIDGRLENTGEKALKKLKYFIEFRDTDGKTISTRSGAVEPKALDPGDEFDLQARVPDSVRAVDVMFRFEDSSGRVVDAANPGPFTIE